MRLTNETYPSSVTTRAISWIMSLSTQRLIAMLTVPDKTAPKAAYLNAVCDVAHGVRRLLGFVNQGVPISRPVGANIARVFDLTFRASPEVLGISTVLGEIAGGESLSPKKAHSSFHAANDLFNEVRMHRAEVLGLNDRQKPTSPSM